MHPSLFGTVIGSQNRTANFFEICHSAEVAMPFLLNIRGACAV